MIKTLSFFLFTALSLSLIAQNNGFQKVTEKAAEKQNYFGSSGDIDGEYAVVC